MRPTVALLDLLLPPACLGCRRHGTLLCRHCLAALRAPSAPEDRFAGPDAGVVIGQHVALAVSAFAYEGPLRRALSQLKYEGAGRAAPVLARTCLPAFRSLLAVSGPATLTPVPIHVERQRARGYNQATLIANELGAATGLPVRELLVRARSTTKMHRLDRAGRLRNLRGAIDVARGAQAPAVAIVVDDIITTSATLDACAATLLGAGSRVVYGFALARET
jgi:ComF family protein